jgi:hypothetical protein
MKEDEMGGTCSAFWEHEKYTLSFSRETHRNETG